MLLAEFGFGPIAFEFPKALVATIVGFVLLVAFLYRMAGPGVSKHFATRTTQIAEQIEQADRQLADAQQIRDDYAARIGSIEVEHRQRLDAAVRDADAARAEIIADAQTAARALQRRTAEEIARERTKQRILLRQQIVQITLDAAEQSVLELETETSHRQLIADFIGRVGVHAAKGKGASAAAGPVPDDVAANGTNAAATQTQIQRGA